MTVVKNRIPSITALAICGLFCLVSAANAFRSDQITSFLSDILCNNPIAAKWSIDIRYNTIGLNEEEIYLFDRICVEISDASGVRMTREEKDVNVMFMFSSDISKDIKRDNVYRLFRKKGESYEDYVDRVKGTSGSDSLSVANVQPISILNYFYIQERPASNIKKVVIYRALFKMLFASLSDSSHIAESVMNVDTESYLELSQFDRCLIESYYSHNIKHGMLKDAAVDVLGDEMYKALRSL